MSAQPVTTMVGRVVLGRYLSWLRHGRGMTPKAAVANTCVDYRALQRYETALSAIPEPVLEELLRRYGRGTPQGLADGLGFLKSMRPEEVTDRGYYAEERLRAVEDSATAITVVTHWVSPPILTGLLPYVSAVVGKGKIMPYSRPRPHCPITLFLEDAVLRRPLRGAGAAAAQFEQWADLAAEGVITLGVFEPIEAVPPQGGLLSEITLPNITVWVQEQDVPVYSTGLRAAWRRDLVQEATAAALNPQDSLAAVREASRFWTARGAVAAPA
ncbi:Scr1 family TA system antitoxin-like transcriptional regulator [Streptomyces sp. NPDC098789]|uniref:Scr1 family TA system antitoxin-like transcriptional regulator n=1 Tax=Streptomyces sp. NPDC098789 TaxID=3366098 RepID=UPI00380D781C